MEPLHQLGVRRHPHLHHVGVWLHAEGPEVPALSDSRVTDDVVQADVAAGLNALGLEQEGHAGHTLHRVTPLTQHKPLRAEATLVIKQAAEH